jgi:hypothetical protein
MGEKINYAEMGLSKAEALAKLYNRSKPQGMGMLHFDPKPMPIADAQAMLDDGHTYFDYVQGRVLKVDLSEDEFDPRLYDCDNGTGAALEALKA